MINFDLEKNYGGNNIIGIDEVGYGAWAGPIVVCGVVIDIKNFPVELLSQINDSKSLIKIKREKIFQELFALQKNLPNEQKFCWWHLAYADAKEIDKSNVLRANLSLINQVIDQLSKQLDIKHVLIDGIHLPKNNIAMSAIKNGDSKSYSIALASIIAKVSRDNFMKQEHQRYSVYGWDTNVGYGTKIHRMAIEKYGISPLHRLSYKPLRKYIVN